MPVKPALAVYFTVPSALILTVPLLPFVAPVTTTLLPSKASFANTSMSTDCPLVTVAVSLKASCSGVTVTVMI